LWAEQVPAKLGPTVPELAPLLSPVATPVEKCAFSCIRDDRFAQRLAATRRDQFLLAGIEAHVCVFQTAADLLEKGYEVHVAADGVASRTEENRRIGLDRIAREGGVVSSVEMALFELSGQAGGDEFRRLVGIVK
ncbi:MAG: isochorismatase family protein, partial [Nitrospinae bacterium]|nr:isochorismatase family protein [Nitrospinota bacterium]